jgi:membrane-associated HD superfamily phosphohydrolase
MDPFDQLRRDWIAAPVPDVPAKLVQSVANQQRKTIFTNIGVSLSFAAVYVVIFWVYTTYDDHTPAFYTSLILMAVLLGVYLTALWTTVMVNVPDPTENTRTYALATVKKLELRRFLLDKGTPVYGILLTAILFLYYTDVLMHASLTFKLTAYGLTGAYLVIVSLLSNKKRKRQIAELDALIADVKQMIEPL